MLRRNALVAMVVISMAIAPAQAQDEGGKPDSQATVSALIRQLQGSDIDRRDRALDALLKVEPMTPAAIRALSDAMRNPDDAVRQCAVQVLACSGPGAIPALALAIDDNDKQVRLRAVEGLGDMAGGRDCYQTRGTAAEEAAAGAKTWPILISAFKDAHEDVRSEATVQFYQDKPAAVPLLRNALKDSDPKVRLGAAKALWQMGSEAKDACGDDLVLALKDPDSAVREEALNTLSYIDPTRKELLPILIQRLGAPDLKVRDKAVEQLQRMKGNAEAAVPALAHLLATQTARNIYPHLAVIYALQDIGTANAAPVLAQVLSGELVPAIEGPRYDPRSIGVVGGPPRIEEDPQADLRRIAAAAIGRLGANGVAALPALERALANDKDPKVRMNAGMAIGALGAGGALGVTTLKKALSDDKDPEVRWSSASAIGKLGSAGVEGLPALEQALKDDDSTRVQNAAANAIGELGSNAVPAIPELIAAMSTSNKAAAESPPLAGESVQETASRALAKIGTPCVPALIAAMQSPDAGVRDGATKALGSIQPLTQDAVAALTAALKDKDSKVREDAASTLYTLGGAAKHAADAEFDQEEKANAAAAAEQDARRYTEKEIKAPVETEIDGEKYKLELAESLPIKSPRDTTGPAKFLVTLHRGTAAPDRYSSAPQELDIWKRTGNDQYQLLYGDDPGEMSMMMGEYGEPFDFSAKVLVTGQGKDHYENGVFLDVPSQMNGTGAIEEHQVFALDPDAFGEVKMQPEDNRDLPKLRPGESMRTAVRNSFSNEGLRFSFDISGYGDRTVNDASAGTVNGTYKIVKEMRYDSKKKEWAAEWKMVVDTAKRGPIQESSY